MLDDLESIDYRGVGHYHEGDSWDYEVSSSSDDISSIVMDEEQEDEQDSLFLALGDFEDPEPSLAPSTGRVVHLNQIVWAGASGRQPQLSGKRPRAASSSEEISSSSEEQAEEDSVISVSSDTEERAAKRQVKRQKKD